MYPQIQHKFQLGVGVFSLLVKPLLKTSPFHNAVLGFDTWFRLLSPASLEGSSDGASIWVSGIYVFVFLTLGLT